MCRWDETLVREARAAQWGLRKVGKISIKKKTMCPSRPVDKPSKK